MITFFLLDHFEQKLKIEIRKRISSESNSFLSPLSFFAACVFKNERRNISSNGSSNITDWIIIGKLSKEKTKTKKTIDESGYLMLWEQYAKFWSTVLCTAKLWQKKNQQQGGTSELRGYLRLGWYLKQISFFLENYLRQHFLAPINLQVLYTTAFPAGNYRFKFNNRNTRKRCKIYPKLAKTKQNKKKTPERQTLNKQILAGFYIWKISTENFNTAEKVLS